MIKRKIIKVFCILLSIVSVISFTACSSCGKKDDKDNVSVEVPEIKKENKTFEKTAINLVEGSHSSYSIVIPEEADSSTEFAASELTEFIKQSSGVVISTVVDSGMVFDETQKYISLGQTTLLSSAGVEITKEQLGESGYIIKTIGNTLFIAGITADTFKGTVYGVYDFLFYTIGFKTYAVDEIVYNKMDTIPLYKFDETYRPSIDMRFLAMRRITSDVATGYRMKLLGSNSDVWSSFTHTLISTYLPRAKYEQAHPDWYANSGQQLCLTNEEMIAEMIIQVENRLAMLPSTTKVMLGHEDNNAVCKCENCMKVVDGKYGGNYSGLELEFTIKVAKEVDKWAEANYPGRKISYAFFAYGPTINAPVNYDSNTDTYTKCNPDLVIPDNVGVLIAPIAMNFARTPQHTENASAYQQMKNWYHLFGGKNIAIWNYCLNAYSYFFNLNNFGVIQDYYRFFEEIGTTYIFDQGNYDSNICTFEDLRIYVQSQLMWDNTQSYEELAEEFMNQYYGLASTAIKKYYNAVRAHYHALENENKCSGTIFFLLDEKGLWPIGIVNAFLEYFNEAFEAIEPLKETNRERYDVLYARIQKERLSPLYMMLSYYIDQLSDEVKESYINDFERYTKMFEIEATREGSLGSVTERIAEWRKTI